MAGDRAELAHLYRRVGFGARPDELTTAVAAGYEATVERLLAAPGVDPGEAATPPPRLAALYRVPKKEDKDARLEAYQQIRADRTALTGWWVRRMVAVREPLLEKAVFFWHGHWATSLQKVRFPVLMQRQLDTLRTHALGDFGAMARAMVRDPALTVWLDNHRNTRKAPNENLGRELMELFALGIGHYTERDVKEAARALTGFKIDYTTGRLELVPARRDPGKKTVLGVTGPLDDVALVAAVLARPESADFVLGRLWTRFGAAGPPPRDTVVRLREAYGEGRDVRAAVRALLLDPAFRAPANRGSLVKQPVEYVVGTLRALALTPEQLAAPAQAGTPAKKTPAPKAKAKMAGGAGPVLASLRAMGQVPLLPPSVGGWPEGQAWLGTAATRARVGFAGVAARAADLSAVADASPADRPDAAARLLSVDWTPATRAVLAGATDDPVRLVTLALVAPEYTVS